MALQTDEILAKLGLDYSSMTAGTLAMLDQQKKAAADYVSFWNKALADQQASEVKANAQSLARLKEYQAARLAEQKAYFEAQAALYAEQDAVAAVGQGSVPVGWGGAMRGAGNVGKEAETEVKGIGRVSRGLKEIGVLIRDMTGIGIVVTIFRSLGTALKGIAEIAGGSILGPITAVLTGLWLSLEYLPRLWGGATLSGTYNAWQAEKSGAKDLAGRESDTAGMLRKRISEMVAAGLLTQEQGQGYDELLKRGGEQGLSDVLRQTNLLMPKLHARDAVKRGESGDVTRERELQIQREGLQGAARLNFDLARRRELEGIIAEYRAEGRDTSKEQLELDKTNLQIQQDISEQKKQQDEAAQKAKDRQDEINRLQESISRTEMSLTQHEQEQEGYPTLEALARARVWGNLGPRNLFGWMRTEQGDIAQQILNLQGYRQWNFTHGNLGQANWDTGEITRLKGILASEGYQPQDEAQARIESRLNDLHAALKGVLSVNITDVSTNK